MIDNSKLARLYKPTRLVQALFMVIAATLIASCATTNHGNTSLVAAGNGKSTDALSVAAVRKQPENHAQSEVLWGGTIAKIEHRDAATWLEVIERPLNSQHQPVLSDLSGGRFIAEIPEFLDPADFRVGLPVTIDGSIEGIRIRNIGETGYDFPRVAVSDYQLWLPVKNRVAGRSHYYPSPVFSSLSIGLGVGSRSSIRFGLGNFRGFHGGYGFSRHRNRGHFGYRGRHRGNRRFTRGNRRFTRGRTRFR